MLNKLILMLVIFTTMLFGQYGWDGNNFYVPGIVYSTDNILTGTITITQTLTITNGTDSLIVDVSGSGDTYFTDTDNIHFVGTNVYIAPDPGSAIIKLPSNDGTDALLIWDSGSAFQFAFYSDGDSHFKGDLNVEGSIDFDAVEAGAESAIEAVVDLQHLQGAVTDAQVPDNITTTGLTGTYTFGGGGSGDIASMTYSGGRLTSVTTVP